MHKYLNALTALFLLFTVSCKKDLLHWESVQQLNSGTTSRLNHAKFINDSICVIGGGVQFDLAEVLRSNDGGFTWSKKSYPQAGKEMFGMYASSFGYIYMCGVDGTVLRSTDNGSNFTFGRISNFDVYVGLSFPTRDTGFFASTILQRNSSITRVDSNLNIIDDQQFSFGLNDIYMVSPSTGYAVGYGAVMKTINNGNSWNFQDPKDDNFTAMDIHGDEIWMCGANGCVYHTADAGTHWQRYRNGNDIALIHYGLRCILFKDELNGWAAGDNGRVIHTDDGGHHWALYDQFTTYTIRSITFCPNGDLLVTGDNGVLYRMKVS